MTWEGISVRRDVPRKGHSPMSVGKDDRETLPSQGEPMHLPVTHRPLSQGRCHTARVHGHAEDPAVPVFQRQALGEHVQSSLGGATSTTINAMAGGGGEFCRSPPDSAPAPGSGTLLQR